MGYYYNEDYEDYEEKPPCKDCIVVSTCTRSFAYETACKEYWEYIREKISKQRGKNEDKK